MECSPFRADGAGGAQAGLRAPSIEPLGKAKLTAVPPPPFLCPENVSPRLPPRCTSSKLHVRPLPTREVFGLLASVKVAPSEGELESTIGASRDDLGGSEGGGGRGVLAGR